MATANEALQKIRQKLNKLEKLDSNWLYNLRMNEAEQRRKQNFTKKQINSQLF